MDVQSSRLKRLPRLAVAIAAAALALAGCGGDGSTSSTADTTAPISAATVPATTPIAADKTNGTVDALQLTFNDLKDRALSGKILGADTSGNQPIVTFQVVMKDTNEGVKGLRTFALHIAQLKPAANGSASYWQNYIASGLPLTAVPAFTERGASTQTAPVNPSADAVTVYNSDGTVKAQGYSVVDNGDGTYVVTFGANIKANANVAYDPTLIHRVAVGVRGVSVPGVVGKTPGAYAGPVNPLDGSVFAQFTNTNGANLVYDFTPAAAGAGATLVDTAGKQTYARDNVNSAACNQCHYKIEYGFPRGNNTSGHFGSRPDTKLCVMCHTPQNTAGKGDFTKAIHKLHMGEELKATEALFWDATANYNEIKYPQDVRKCATCHKGTVADSWSKATLKACGACHNAVDFAKGSSGGHIGGVKTDDATCALCHDAADISVNHVPVTKVTSATSGVTSNYANNSGLPSGAYKLGWVIKSVSVDTARKVSVAFQITKDGAAVNFGTYNATTNPNIIPNTIGGPSLRIAYNVKQDGITSPADFNAYMSLPGLGIGAPSVSTTATPPGTFTPASTASSVWANPAGVTASGITWTMTGPDSANTYTIKSSLPLPAETTMVMAFMYGSMTQTNVAGYPYAAASIADFASYLNSSGQTAYALKSPGLVLAPANAKTSYTNATTKFVARRTIVDNAKCLSCHDQLGVKPNFHGGGRNDGSTCNICHNPNGANKGWSYSFNTFIHGIHAANMRTKAYTFASDWSTVTYPGLLKNCEQCHVAGSYDFSAAASSGAVGKLLYNTVATGNTAAADATTSSYIAQTAGTAYGSGFSYSTSTGAVVTTAAAGTTLISSPISAACFSCHDSTTAKNHMETNGGSIYQARSTVDPSKPVETCLVCHGPANNAAFNDSVPSIKRVHRWW